MPLRGLWSIAALDGRAFLLIAGLMLPLAVIPASIGLWRSIGDARDDSRFELPMWLLLINAAVIVFTPGSFREPLAMALSWA